MPLLPSKLRPSRSPNDAIQVGAVVDYENAGKPLVAIVIQEKKGKWVITDERARESQLSSDRLYLLSQSTNIDINSQSDRLSYLTTLSNDANEQAQAIDLTDAWEVLAEEKREVTIEEITDLIFNSTEFPKRLAVRRALLNDKIYFKRRKKFFEPRAAHVVEELLVQAANEAKKEVERKKLIECLILRIDNQEVTLPCGISDLETLAVLGTHAPNAKSTIPVIEQVIKAAHLNISGPAEKKAFELLVAARHFSPHENLAMHRFQRFEKFSPELCEEAEKATATLSTISSEQRLDFTKLHAITIDSAETQDIDDALSIESTESGFRLGIHISDVASLIDKDSALNTEAFHRASTIYCPERKIPMFPKEISENAASLLKGQKRPVVSFVIDLNNDLDIINRSISRSIIEVKEQIPYDEVDRVLFAEKPTELSSNSKNLETLLKLWDIADCLENRRMDKGAVYFNRREMNPVINPDGSIALESNVENSPSRKLIEEMMILANETAGLYAIENNIPILFRSQNAPDVMLESVGLDIPEGIARDCAQRSCMKRSAYSTNPSAHFGLGLSVYTQVTSPIRRAMDLVNQRQLCEFVDTGVATYDKSEITELLGRIETHLVEAYTVQRESNRYWILKYLEQENIKELQGTVVKTTGKRPLAEVDILFSLFPFNPAARRSKDSAQSEKRLGEVIQLKVDQLNPRSDRLVLSEVEN